MELRKEKWNVLTTSVTNKEKAEAMRRAVEAAEKTEGQVETAYINELRRLPSRIKEVADMISKTPGKTVVYFSHTNNEMAGEWGRTIEEKTGRKVFYCTGPQGLIQWREWTEEKSGVLLILTKSAFSKDGPNSFLRLARTAFVMEFIGSQKIIDNIEENSKRIYLVAAEMSAEYTEALLIMNGIDKYENYPEKETPSIKTEQKKSGGFNSELDFDRWFRNKLRELCGAIVKHGDCRESDYIKGTPDLLILINNFKIWTELKNTKTPIESHQIERVYEMRDEGEVVFILRPECVTAMLTLLFLFYRGYVSYEELSEYSVWWTDINLWEIRKSMQQHINRLYRENKEEYKNFCGIIKEITVNV